MEAHRRPPPIPRLHISDEVDFFLGSLHVVKELFEALGNPIKIEPDRSHFCGLQEVAEPVPIKGHVADENFVFTTQQNQSDRITGLNFFAYDVHLLESTVEPRRVPSSMLHAKRCIKSNDHSGPRLAGEPT